MQRFSQAFYCNYEKEIRENADTIYHKFDTTEGAVCYRPLEMVMLLRRADGWHWQIQFTLEVVVFCNTFPPSLCWTNHADVPQVAGLSFVVLLWTIPRGFQRFWPSWVTWHCVCVWARDAGGLEVGIVEELHGQFSAWCKKVFSVRAA